MTKREAAIGRIALKDIPKDWASPDWLACNKVHEWKNYANEELRAIWDTFNDRQKQILAKGFNEEASREEWD